MLFKQSDWIFVNFTKKQTQNKIEEKPKGKEDSKLFQ